MNVMGKPKPFILTGHPTKSVKVTTLDGESGHQMNRVSQKMDRFWEEIRAQTELRLVL